MVRHNAVLMDDDKYLKLSPGWDQLFVTDTRSEEEKQAAQAKENARLKGRRTKNWHLKYIDEHGRLKD